MDFNHLDGILKQLIRRLEYRNFPHVFELKRELHHLNENERMMIQNRMKKQEYNIGTFSVMRILKEVNIMNFCEYLEGIKDDFEVMQIITELFDDSVNSLDLLVDVLASNKFQAIIDESLKNYIQDLINHPELIKIELISSTSQTLPVNLFQHSILKKSLQHFVNEDNKSSSDLTQVLTQQKEWNEQFGTNEKLSSMFKSIMEIHSEFIAKELKIMIKTGGINWFYVLMIVNNMNANCSGHKIIKDLILSYFKKFRENNDLTALLMCLLLSRQLYHYSLETSTYSAFVKHNFGGLKYTIKKSEDFNDLIQTLQNIVVYENDPVVIHIHVMCQISAPSKMYSTVLEYKVNLKSKEEMLLNKMEL